MFKVILFDFDGVIVDSDVIKTQAFIEVFKDYPELAERIADYHITNGGISRYVKIRYIYEEFLSKEISEDEVNRLAEEYGRIVKSKVIASAYIPGAEETLAYTKDNFDCYIISGTPETELREIVEEKGISEYFKGVYGSPRGKADIAHEIIEREGYKREEVVFIGDATTDFDASMANKISFVARMGTDSSKGLTDARILKKVNDLHEFTKFLKEGVSQGVIRS